MRGLVLIALGAQLLGGCGWLVAAGTDDDAGDTGTAPTADASAIDGASPADASRPDNAAPDAGLADAAEPDAFAPDAAGSDRAEPDSADPDASLPDAAEPDASIPDGAEPDASIPDAGDDNWLDPLYGARQRITLHNTSSEDLTAFPVLIRLEQGCADLSLLRPDRADLLVIDDDSKLRLPHEVDWSTETALHFWITPQLVPAASDTTVWLYYGNPNAPASEQPHEVWRDDFRAVWHMGGYPDDEVLPDSSGLANHAAFQAPLSVEAGMVGQARRFVDGPHPEAPDHDSLDLGDEGAFTLEAWVRTDVVELDGRYILQKRGSYQIAAMRGYNGGEPEIIVWVPNGDDNSEGTSASQSLTVQTWTYVVGLYDEADHTMRLFIDGLEDHASTLRQDLDPWQLIDSSNGVMLGNSFLGLLDELRISAGRRSDAWIRSQYEVSAGDFVELGPCEAIPN